MGGGGSSSRRKSSKRKRKRDRKKRSPRKESRKRQRRCDSLYSGHNKNLSTSSDDQSMSSDSDSKSAYDRRHKHRRAEQSRLSLKSTKKGRDRKRPGISSNDSDAGNVRKSTRSRRDVKTRKKSSKKRSRKHLSSSQSYDSESCSTCPSSSSDGKHLKSEAITDKERARGRESHKAHKRHRIRSPSYSSHSSRSNHSVGVSHGGETVNNHRCLRSVIAIADQSCNEETNRWEMDPQKEVIVYDKEDYPSPRSLDSNEHANKMESGNDYHDPLSNRACVEDIAGEKASEPVYVVDRQPKRSHRNGVVVKDHDVPVPAAALDDLESTLRQKALENLKKFRGELPSISLKMENSGSDVNVMATQEANNKLPEQGSSDVQVINQRVPSSKRNPAHLIEVQKSPGDGHNGKGYEMIEQNDAVNPHDGPAHLGCSKEDLGTSSQTVLLPTSDTNSGAVATNPMASVGIFTGNNRLDQENGTTDGSQFEQRTMSVMRGGEAVQVSYKVYIPKRTPALARRQLKR